jgi:hypothetical protein
VRTTLEPTVEERCRVRGRGKMMRKKTAMRKMYGHQWPQWGRTQELLKELAREELGADVTVLLSAKEEDPTTLLVSRLANSADALVVSPDMEDNS